MDGTVTASLRRVTLFATDLPPELLARTPVLEAPDTAAGRAADPAAFREQARQRGMLAAYFTVFESPVVGAGTALVTSSAIRFGADDGARAQLASFRTEGADALVRGSPLLPPAVVPGPPPWEAVTPPAVGDEALAWRSGPGTRRSAATGVAFRRGPLIVIVIVAGDADAVALARTLDSRAMAALRP